MNILLFSHGAGPYGAERILAALANGLARRGHSVTVDFPHHGPAVESVAACPGVKVQVTPRHRLPRNVAEALTYFLTAPRAIAAARRSVRSCAPDVVWVNSMYNPWCAIGARMTGGPVVWHLHEATPPQPVASIMAVLTGWTAARVVTVSEFVADGLRPYSWLRDRLVVMPNPFLAELDRVQKRSEVGDPFTVGYLGQLEAQKRVPDLVAAIGHLQHVRGVIVGDGKARRDLESTVQAAGLDDRVELQGYRTDIAQALHQFDCVAIPSVREAFGLVALEAMAAGVPVVAARSGALPEVLGPAALYHTPRDPEDLARKIAKLKADPALRTELADRGLDRVNRFSRDVWLDDAEALARTTIEETRSRT